MRFRMDRGVDARQIWRRNGDDARRFRGCGMCADVHNAFVEVRRRALAWRDPEAPAGSPSGVILETGYPEGVVMLAVMSDGTLSLFSSSGGSVLGGGAFPGPAQAGRQLALAGAHFAPRMQIVTTCPLPKLGVASLYVMIDGLVRGVSGAEKDFGENRSPFSPLFHAAHHVIAEIRRIRPPEKNGAQS
jgi:hypothetical protein